MMELVKNVKIAILLYSELKENMDKIRQEMEYTKKK